MINHNTQILIRISSFLLAKCQGYHHKWPKFVPLFNMVLDTIILYTLCIHYNIIKEYNYIFVEYKVII